MLAPPCGHPFDSQPADGCAYCRIRDIPFHRQRWTKSEPPLPAPPTIAVSHCAANGNYKWALTAHTGIAIASGSAATEPEAEDAAESEYNVRAFHVTKRNLLFHMLPVAGRWQWHADQLRGRASLFNGRRIMAILTGDCNDTTTRRGHLALDEPWRVQEAFPGWEFLEIPNDPTLREVATFEPLFGSLEPTPGEVTLYAHSKGVTYAQGATARRWTEILYETCCDYWLWVERLLNWFPLAGPFGKAKSGWAESASQWHFSGSWFWFRNHDLLSKPDWRRIDRFWSGIEPYPSLHFPASQAACVFHSGQVPTLNLYDWRYIREQVEPDLAKWRQEHAGERTAYA